MRSYIFLLQEPTIKLAKREITLEEQTIYYQVTGEGEPIILIHGLSGSSRWWVRNVPALAMHYQVYLIDLPGFGSMHRYSGRFLLNEVAAYIVTWMEALGIRQAHLVGHSMGGYICMWIAAHKPDLVKRLVLVSPAGIPRYRSILGYAVPLLVSTRYLTPAFFTILAYDALRAGPITLLQAAQDLLTKDLRDSLQDITAPTLLVWGENDILVPPSLGDILHREIAHSRLLIVKRAAHVSMFDRSEQFNAAVLKFLGGEVVGT